MYIRVRFVPFSSKREYLCNDTLQYKQSYVSLNTAFKLELKTFIFSNEDSILTEQVNE